MPKIHLLGNVLPVCVNITAAHLPSAKWQEPETNLEMEFTIKIVNSEIDIECDTSSFGPESFIEIYRRALDLCKAAVNLLGFAHGYGVATHLHTVVHPNGDKKLILFEDRSLAAICTAYGGKLGYDQMLKIVLSDPALFMALDDLVAAITVPNEASVNCARAIEGIRHLIATSGNDVSTAWAQMRDCLKLDRSYLQPIMDNSVAPRHGDRRRISGAIVSEIGKRSWTIMNRYLEYRKRGSQPLPETEFPVLRE